MGFKGKQGPALLLGVGVVAVFLGHAFYLGGVAEDAFISFRFARNLVEGHGLVWNVGEPPVEGYTNFLWVLLSALWIRLGIDPVRAAQLLGVAASLATLLGTWRCGRLLRWSPGAALLAPAFLALSGPFAGWATGGLETSAFGAWLVFAVFHFARAVREEHPRDAWLCSLFLLLAMLTRPEGAVASFVLLASAPLGSPAARRVFRAPAVSCLALFGLYFAWRWSYFGQPLPNTFYAKTGGGFAQGVRGARYAGWFALHYLLPWLPLLVLAARPPRRRAALAAAVREPLLAAAAALLGVLGLVVVWEGGDYMALYRFMVPVLPFLYLLLGSATWRALRATDARALGAAALACAALGTAFHSTPLEAELLPGPAGMHGNWRGVQTERWHVARLSTLGEFFAREGRAGESLATDAIGAIGWYGGLTVYGAHGLVDPALARGAGRRLGRGVAGHERLDFAYLFSKRPTFLMFRRDLRPEKLRRLSLNLELPEALAQEYELRSVWLEDPANGEAGWFSFLERRDRNPKPPATPNGV